MPLYRATRPALPNLAAGNYVPCQRTNSLTTSITLGNGSLRLAPWVIETTLRIDRVVGDVATVGEAGSKFRIGIYADNGSSYPGTLLLDAGQIAGDSATVQELTVSLTLAPGLYWTGGAVQSAPTTQPTMRTVNSMAPEAQLSLGTTLPSANSTATAYLATGVTAALPATFGAGNFGSFAAPRILVRTA